MILVDANLLVYAHVGTFPHHKRALEWLDEQLNGSTPVGLPWPSLLAFLRLVTNPRIFSSPASVSAAWQQVHAWLHCEPVWIPQPTNHHAMVLARLLAEHSQITPNLIPDAHLAALSLEHGLTLCSSDTDFARFSGLQWLNPLL